MNFDEHKSINEKNWQFFSITVEKGKKESLLSSVKERQTETESTVKFSQFPFHSTFLFINDFIDGFGKKQMDVFLLT